MKFFEDLSLAYKTPLRICALVVATALLVTASLVLREREELRRDLIANSAGVARLLANTLVDPLVHDDVWRTYELISAPFQRRPAPGAGGQTAELVMVLDTQHRIFVSTDPTRYPMLGNPAYLDGEYAQVEAAVAAAPPGEPTAILTPSSGKLYMVLPILYDGVETGTLVLAYSGSVFAPRFAALAERAALVTLIVLALLLPAGWFWGGLVARPLVDLARAMGKVGPEVPEQVPYVQRYKGRDEIGRLGHEFQRMLRELKEKRSLEQQMVVSDRLASIGRLTAGIAHEINNPLGGMLNAISTFRRHGTGDEMTAKTLSLIERGLRQIRETVAALLVEARVESHELTREDVEDTRTLVLPDAQARDVRLAWHNGIRGQLPLPSTPTRQILINLLYNAVQAVDRGGKVDCSIGGGGGALEIEVVNDGRHIPAERLPYLMEPFWGASGERQGLGLWVTYQIVQQLGGRIQVTSVPGRTGFAVHLPLKVEDEHQTSAVPG